MDRDPEMDGPSPDVPDFRSRLRRGLGRGGHALWVIVRVTIPTFVVMDFLKRMGVIDRIGEACAPVMTLFRLPGEAAIPVLLGLLLNVFTATAALGSLGLSGGQVTTLALMVGMAHTLVIETAVLKSAGARVLSLLGYRLLMAVLVGLVASRLLIGAAP
ncbi:MAG TPA: nucleoside recognition domain-containing protein [Candidatus Binatia bacterium]|nr:nucleoside recognition domain-containing protein [Candidatus Binatia bacterium]